MVVNLLLKTKIGKYASSRSQFIKNQNEYLDIPQTICSALTVILWIYKVGVGWVTLGVGYPVLPRDSCSLVLILYSCLYLHSYLLSVTCILYARRR